MALNGVNQLWAQADSLQSASGHPKHELIQQHTQHGQQNRSKNFDNNKKNKPALFSLGNRINTP
jgi:hypothetical protein